MPPRKRPRKGAAAAVSSPEAQGHSKSISDEDSAFSLGNQNDTQDSQDTSPTQPAIPDLDEDEIPDDPQDAGMKTATDTATGAAGRRGYTRAGGYNVLKSFNGQFYSGMAVGGSHTWNYDQGVWKETKEEPDLWKINYETKKRRAKTAPAGSGAPVGAEYHWLIVAHQVCREDSLFLS